MKRIVLLLAALTIAASCHAREVRIPLRYAAGEGAIFDTRGAIANTHVPVADTDGFIAMEAEWADRHQFDPDIRHAKAPIPEDAGASAGAFLDHAVFASYELLANADGDYWLWARVRTGEGHWRFRDVVKWQALEYEFETPPDLSRATLYLYNVESPDTAYFDDVHIEDLGPVGQGEG